VLGLKKGIDMMKKDKRSKGEIKESEEDFTMEDIDEVIEETKERIDEVNEINQKPKSWFKKRYRTR